MQLQINSMNKYYAKEILSWKYDKPYDFYNSIDTEDSRKELLDGFYYAVVKENGELFGYFCIGTSAQVPIGHQVNAYRDNFIDMGLGMNPKYVGQGSGFFFCSFILQSIHKKYKGVPIRLTVATFNKRAVHLYEKLGFVKEREFHSDKAQFMTMVRT